MSTPPIQPNFSIQITTDHTDSHAESTCKKIIKLLVFIILTVATLGLFLVWKYGCSPTKHTISKAEATSKTTAGPIFILNAKGQLTKLPAHITPDSLEFLCEIEKHGLHPISAQMNTPLGTSNPGFIASYPHGVSTISMIRLQEQSLLATSEQARQVAAACLSQLNHLNQNYYLVTVPGDNNCFFKSYAISWLHYLHKNKQTNPNIFTEEIQRLLQLPFAHSSHKHALLTQKVVHVLQECQNLSSINQLYNDVILSHDFIQNVVQYLKQLAFYVADQQKCDVLGENGLRALLVAQIKENKLLLERAALQFFGTSYASHRLMEAMLSQPRVFDLAEQECLFILEFLPLCLLSQQQLNALPASEREKHMNLSILLSSFLTFLDFKVRQKIKPEEIDHFLQDRFQEPFAAFTQYWQAKYPALQFSVPMLFYLFLRMHPHHLDNTTLPFTQQIAGIIHTITDGHDSLASFLDLNPAAKEAFNQILMTCRARALSIDLVESFLQTPLKTPTALLASLDNLQDQPTLRKIYQKIFQHLLNIPLSLGQQEQLQQAIAQFFASAPTALVNKFMSFKVALANICHISTSHIDDANALVHHAAILFLFFLQQEKLVENQDGVTTISAMFMPYLQESMRTGDRLNISLLAQACGDLCAIELPSINQSQESVFKSILSLMFKNLHAASLLHTLFHLPSVFGHKLPSTLEADALIAEVRQAVPEAWENHLQSTQVLSKLLLLNSEHVSSGKSFLLISFLMQNQELIEDIAPDLRGRLKQLLHHVTQLINEHVQGMPQVTQNMLLLRYNNLSQIYHRTRQGLISRLTSDDEKHLDSFLNWMVIRCIEQMNLQDLLKFSHEIYFQAEDEHVLAISSALGRLSLCQSLQDIQFVNDPEQVLSLVNTQGFLSLDFLPEEQGSVFVFKEHNHYSALLPKDAIETNETNHLDDMNNPHPPKES